MSQFLSKGKKQFAEEIFEKKEYSEENFRDKYDPEEVEDIFSVRK